MFFSNIRRFLRIFIPMCFYLRTSLQTEKCQLMKPDTRDVPGPMNVDSGSNFNLFPTLAVPISGRITNISFYAHTTGSGYVSFWQILGNDSFELVTKVEISSGRANSLQWFAVEGNHYVNVGNVLAVHYKENVQSGILVYESSAHARTNSTSVYKYHTTSLLKDNGWTEGKVIYLNEIHIYKRGVALHIEICQCDSGTYGIDCTSRCSANCQQEGHCNRVTGACTGGCAGGYYPPLCLQICEGGKYGENCSQSCSGNCRGNRACNIATGHCDNGCQDGFYETNTCLQRCASGTYGYNCSRRCSGNCIDGDMCSSRDGSCEMGCREGYDYDAAVNCSIQCGHSKFGKACSHTCHCKSNSSCNPVTGECPNGCDKNWHGVTCSVTLDKVQRNYVDQQSGIGWIAAVVVLSVLLFAAVATVAVIALLLKRTQNATTMAKETEMSRKEVTLNSLDSTLGARHQNSDNSQSSAYESIQTESEIKSIPDTYDILNVYQNE